MQVSTATMWWTPASGIPLLAADALLAIALLDGALAERLVIRVTADALDAASARVSRAVFGSLASAAWVIAAVACLRLATTVSSPADGGCGSALRPTHYDCVPLTRTVSTTLLAVIALVAGGMVMSLLRSSGRLRLSRRAASSTTAVGVVLMLAAIVVVPHRRPSAATQALELAVVVERVHVGVVLLMLALTVVCTSALVRHGDRLEVPVLSALAGLVNAAIAGVAIASLWIAVLADYMMGP